MGFKGTVIDTLLVCYLICGRCYKRSGSELALDQGMAGISGEESGAGKSAEGTFSGQRCQSGEALAEWRSSEQVENGTPSTSPPYWDTDDDDDGEFVII